MKKAELKQRLERMARDQAEHEIHLAVLNERAAKRESELRQNLQVFV